MKKPAKLVQFLSELAVDPQKLGEFLHEPKTAMRNLSEKDRDAMMSGDQKKVSKRMGFSGPTAFAGYMKSIPWIPQSHVK